MASHSEDMIYIPFGKLPQDMSGTAGEKLVNGFIREAQALLSYKDNPYFIIQRDLIIICKSYIYWCRMDKFTNSYTQKQRVYIDPIIIKRTQSFYYFNQDLYPARIDGIRIMNNRFSYVLHGY